MKVPIFSLEVADALKNKIVVVHETTEVSLLNLDLKAFETFQAPSTGSRVTFAKGFTFGEKLYLLMCTESKKSKNVSNSLSIYEVSSSAVTHQFTNSLEPLDDVLDICFDPSTLVLSMLVKSAKVMNFKLSITAEESGLTPLTEIFIQDNFTPLKIVSFPNYVAVLQRTEDSDKSLAQIGKSCFSVFMFDVKFGTCQGKTRFDADILNHLEDGQGKINLISSDLLAMDDQLISCLAVCPTKRGPSKALILRSDVTFPPLTLMSVLGKGAKQGNKVALSTSSFASLKSALPESDDLTEWRKTLQNIQDIESQLVLSLKTATSVLRLETEFFKFMEQLNESQKLNVRTTL
jgi:hypothetical protein